MAKPRNTQDVSAVLARNLLNADISSHKLSCCFTLKQKVPPEFYHPQSLQLLIDREALTC